MYGTFSEADAVRKGMAPFEPAKVIDDAEDQEYNGESSRANDRNSKDDHIAQA